MFNSLRTPIAVVAHDAGAANHLISWVKNAGHEQVRACVRGPALTLWNRVFPYANTSDELADVLAGAATLISGTGWASTLEHDARKMARQLGVRSVAVIDHWTNYHARFIRDGIEVLPDEIWVTDVYAKTLAESTFANLKITLLPNFYLDSLVQELIQYECQKVKGTGRNLLYVLEPIRESWGADVVAGEFLALDFFVNNLSVLGLGDGLSIRLRPHPSDPVGKYDQWIKAQKNMQVSLDNSAALAESIAWSDIVVGCQTYALVVALAAGRQVVSSIPPWAPSCVLPQSGIIKLSDLLPQTFNNTKTVV